MTGTQNLSDCVLPLSEGPLLHAVEDSNLCLGLSPHQAYGMILAASAGNELGSGPVRGERLQGEHASPGDRRGSAADTEEDKLRSLGRMRWAFEAWREYAVCKATGHTGLLRQVTEPGEPRWTLQRGSCLNKRRGLCDHLCTRENSGITPGNWWSEQAEQWLSSPASSPGSCTDLL